MIRGLKLSIYWGLQPVLLITAVGIWYADPTFELTYLYLIVGVQLVLGMTEHYSPARPEWLIRTRQKSINVILVFFLTLIALTLANFYVEWLAAPLAVFRNMVGLDIWPHHWPILAQLLMVFFASEFIWYWMHRAEHRWTWVWRLSGHGVHHSFKKLNALNFGLNHPIEYFFIVLPSILVELIFGVGVAAAGASVLTVIQTSIVHSNINLNSRGIGWFFTTNRYHICHHSVDLDESNTNYGCSAIIWDRIFGTFLDTRISEAGTGPTEPSLWKKFLMPIKQPVDTAIAPDS